MDLFDRVFRLHQILRQALRLTPERARWVADEVWHPRQTVRAEGNACVLQVPFSDRREWIMDILKYGPDVEVVAPASLRRAVAARLRSAVKRYSSVEGGP